jgi:hypothetical protein
MFASKVKAKPHKLLSNPRAIKYKLLIYKAYFEAFPAFCAAEGEFVKFSDT